MEQVVVLCNAVKNNCKIAFKDKISWFCKAEISEAWNSWILHSGNFASTVAEIAPFACQTCGGRKSKNSKCQLERENLSRYFICYDISKKQLNTVDVIIQSRLIDSGSHRNKMYTWGRYMKVQSSMHCVFPTCLRLCVFLWLWLWLCVLCLCNVLMFLCVVKQNVFCGVVAPPPEIEPWPNLLWLPRGADTHQLMYCIHDLMTGLWYDMAGQIKFKQLRQIHPAKPMPHIIDTVAF